MFNAPHLHFEGEAAAGDCAMDNQFLLSGDDSGALAE
jgi:hypothetical protein